MTAITELGYVRFGVSDMAAWKVFAAEGLGLEIGADSTDDTVFLRMDQWHHRIILEAGGPDDLVGIGLRVAGAAEFRELEATLEANGISFAVAPPALARQRCVLELMTLEDPAGNPLEIFHGPRIDTHMPFHPGRGMYGKFLTGDGGLGHMIVSHKDLQETWQFYRLLGMRGGIEYQIPTPDGQVLELMFMHCNPRDHTLAFGLPTKGRINHIMLEVDNFDDVMHTYYKVKETWPIAIAPGKHANDHMFSFYCESPSGFQVEIGHGGRPATHQSEYHVRDTYGHEFVRAPE